MHSIPLISIIVAMDEARGIGKENRIPWHIKEDLVRLKKLTLGHVTILGRSTFESMLGYYEKSGRPTMTQRTHIVITRDKNYVVDPKYGLVAHSIDEALRLAKEKETEEIFIIGGAKIFAQTIQFADRLYITLVKGTYPADTYFPEYESFQHGISKEERTAGEYQYTFITVER
jgi:dihydrofolate reductase